MPRWRPRSRKTSARNTRNRQHKPKPIPVATPVTYAPHFYLTGRQTLRPGVLLLAIATAAGALTSVVYGLGRAGKGHFSPGGPTVSRSTDATSGVPSKEDQEDDPNQVDVVVLGDAADAPVPARRGDHISNVHATILVRLPRFGEQVGLIPDSLAGHLLYRWLAAFNQASAPALEAILPNDVSVLSSSAQLELRQQTGGFNLLSAKEVQPGVVVFRLRDQTPDATEVLGTLWMRPKASPARIASFSLRALIPNQQNKSVQ